MPLKDGSWMMPKPGSKVSWLWRASSKFTLTVIGLSSKIWIEWMNTVRVHNKNTLYDLIEKRPEGKGLLTVCNHTSCIDDPLMWGVLRPRILKMHNCMRWTSAAEDICFKRKLHALFFSLGHVFPLVRGDGVYQKGVDFSIEQLNLGSWCHYFPEGKVNMTQEFMRLKWGIGRIISECKITPIVLPMWHVGMDKILPNKKPYIPLIRKHVTLLVGKPMNLENEVKMLKSSKKSPREIRKHITDIIQAEMWAMRTEAESLYAEETRSS
ncbi:tafazzin [Plakobranchus ocellatus]|uniref:Tafazzin family protein n=1 Tax=Plakobranchus ocellatus TaxID=259542 RepID=A0AAV4BRR1_9GAST|nr:tafazzin [Plakobranchus ocellatus]